MFRAYHKKWEIGRKPSVAKMPTDAHNSNDNNEAP